MLTTEFRATECRKAMFSGKLVCSGTIDSMTEPLEWDWYLGSDTAALYINQAFVMSIDDVGVTTTEGLITVTTYDNLDTLFRIHIPVGSLDGVRL